MRNLNRRISNPARNAWTHTNVNSTITAIPRNQQRTYHLPRLSVEELLDQGVTLIEQIPHDFPLTEAQARMCTAVKTARPWVSKTLSKELSRLKYPRYFMDFESLNPAIRPAPCMRPYQQIPFQWSIHRQIETDA